MGIVDFIKQTKYVDTKWFCSNADVYNMLVCEYDRHTLEMYPPQAAMTLFVLSLVVSRKNTENNDVVLQSKQAK